MEKRILKQLFCNSDGSPRRVWLAILSSKSTTPIDIEELCNEAAKDFPWVTKELIQIEKSHEDNSFPRKIGIGFYIPTGNAVPVDYKKTDARIGYA